MGGQDRQLPAAGAPALPRGCAQLGGFRCLWGEGGPPGSSRSGADIPSPHQVQRALLGFLPTSTPEDNVLTRWGPPSVPTRTPPRREGGTWPAPRPSPQAPAGPGRDSRSLPSSGRRGHCRAGTERAPAPHTQRLQCPPARPRVPGDTARLALPSRHSPHGVAQVLVVVVEQLKGVDLRTEAVAGERCRRVRGGCGGPRSPPLPRPGPPPSSPHSPASVLPSSAGDPRGS